MNQTTQATSDLILAVLAEHARERLPEYDITTNNISVWVRKRPLRSGSRLDRRIVSVGWYRPGVLALSTIESHGFLNPLYPTRRYDPTDQTSWDQLLVDLDELLRVYWPE